MYYIKTRKATENVGLTVNKVTAVLYRYIYNLYSHSWYLLPRARAHAYYLFSRNAFCYNCKSLYSHIMCSLVSVLDFCLKHNCSCSIIITNADREASCLYKVHTLFLYFFFFLYTLIVKRKFKPFQRDKSTCICARETWCI